MQKILLDTDIGTDVDDAVALAYLLSHTDCELLGITTVTGEAVISAADSGFGESIQIDETASSSGDGVRGVMLGDRQGLLNREPQLKSERELLAEAYADEDAYQEAIGPYRRAIELKPALKAAYVGLADAYKHLGQRDEEIAVYREAMSALPKDAEIMGMAARSMSETERYAEAIDIQKRVVQIKPDDLQVYRDLGHYQFQARRFQDVVSTFQESLKINPKDGSIVLGTGDRYNGLDIPGCQPEQSALDRFPFLADYTRLYHCSGSGFSPTRKNGFQPRFGLGYALNQKTAVRAGVGMFLNRLAVNRDTALGGNPPFEEGMTVFNGNADSPGGATRRVYPFTTTMQDPVLKTPVAWTWNMTVQRQLPWSISLEGAYVGRRAYNNQRKRNLNQALPALYALPPMTCPASAITAAPTACATVRRDRASSMEIEADSVKGAGSATS